MSYSLTIAQKNAALNALATAHNNGSLKLYSGSVPADVTATLGGATVLVSLPFSATAFGAASNGVITANDLAQTSAVASGTASFYRTFASDGTTALGQGTVGTSGADLNLITTSIVNGAPVDITTYTVSI